MPNERGAIIADSRSDDAMSALSRPTFASRRSAGSGRQQVVLGEVLAKLRDGRLDEVARELLDGEAGARLDQLAYEPEHVRARADHEAVARREVEELVDLADDLACEVAIHVRAMGIAAIVVTEVTIARAIGADSAVGEQLVRGQSPSRIHEIEALG